jgi:uncharacterized DUF497 family protein
MESFRWIGWNVEHIAEHGVTPDEVEYVVEHAQPPYPERTAGDKRRVRGQTSGGRFIQVVYLYSPADMIFVVHARPLTDREKHALRRRVR